MNYNEFKFCCIMFCKQFEGQLYGDVVKDCFKFDAHININLKHLEFDGRFVFREDCEDGVTASMSTLMVFEKQKRLYIHRILDEHKEFECKYKFLEYFNITLKDIV